MLRPREIRAARREKRAKLLTKDALKYTFLMGRNFGARGDFNYRTLQPAPKLDNVVGWVSEDESA